MPFSKEEENLRRKVRELMVNHAKVIEALVGIQRCFEGAIDGGDPRGLIIVGPSGAGKTRILDYVLKKHPRTRGPTGAHIPILVSNIPPKPTVKGLAERLLSEIGEPTGSGRSSENALTFTLMRLIKETGVRVLALDEFQHFVDQGSKKIQHHAADWLKNLITETRISLVVAGLPYCIDVIETNQQMSRRFRAPVKMPQFDWNKVDDREEFKDILATIQPQLKPFELPDLASDEMSYRVYCATGGLIGRLANLLIEATTAACDKNSLTISMHDLDQASVLASYDTPTDIARPFGSDFVVKPDEETVRKVLRIGTADGTPSLAPLQLTRRPLRASEVLHR